MTQTTETKNELSVTQLVLLKRVQAQLEVLGIQYALQLPNGDVLGELELAPSRKKKKKQNWYNDYKIPETLEALQPGQTAVFELKEGYDLSKLQGAICARAVAVLGKENYITARTPDLTAIEILRLE